jgi:predicted nucleotidyltransferase
MSELQQEIVNRLKPLGPEKIIIFGSRAHGQSHEESDIDLYVVTGDDFIPSSFREKMELKLKVAEALRDLKRQYDIDLIVHTKKMNEIFIQNDSLFSRSIVQNGIVLYEQ